MASGIAVGSSFVRASSLNESRNTLSTGYARLDGLTNGLKGGQLYLFYGASAFIDELVHRLVVRASVEGKVAYMNNTNYYREKTLLKADLLALHSKREGVEPSAVLDSVYFAAAYSEFRQPKATGALERIIVSEPSTRVILVHNVSAFLEGNEKNRLNVAEGISRSISALWHLAMERDLIMVVTAKADLSSSSLGSRLLSELASSIVFFRDTAGGVQATLLKHPEKEVPAYESILDGGDSLMGRITPPFRQVYQDLLERLRCNYVVLLRDPGHRKGFELLLRDAWDREHAAMGNAELPLVLDALNLTANIHNSGTLEELRETLREKERRIAALEERVRRLEADRDPCRPAAGVG